MDENSSPRGHYPSTIWMCRTVWVKRGAILIAMLTMTSGCVHPSAVPPTLAAASDADAKALFCAYGGVGLRPLQPPPEYELQFAVAVVEIDSPRDIASVGVSDFVLFNRAGTATRFKRVVQIEEFNRARPATEGSFAHYLSSGGMKAWNGTLRAGRMRLRVRVALIDEPIAPVRFRLTIGPYVIEGPVDGSWPA